MSDGGCRRRESLLFSCSPRTSARASVKLFHATRGIESIVKEWVSVKGYRVTLTLTKEGPTTSRVAWGLYCPAECQIPTRCQLRGKWEQSKGGRVNEENDEGQALTKITPYRTCSILFL